MNPEPSLPAEPDFPFRPLRPAELATDASARMTWLWHGLLAPRKVTALIGASKEGKTTLASILLARFAQGGQLANLPVAPARCFVVSEEDGDEWDERCRRLGIGPYAQFLCRPFADARPTEAQWRALIAAIESLHRREGLDLVMMDTLARLLPGYAETCAPQMLDCLLPLQRLAREGPAVCLMHHPGKGKRADGQASRGSSALTGFADIVMELSCVRRARSRDRRRRICAYSRYAETPRHMILELNAAGTDYLVRTDETGTPIVRMRPELQYILEHTSDRLTVQEILNKWPEDIKPPDATTLFRWLKRAVQQGRMCRGGSGQRFDAFRYWLPGREPLLWPGNHASEEEKQAWRERCRADAQRPRDGNPYA